MKTTAPTHDDFPPKVILQVQQFKDGRWIRKSNKKTIQECRNSLNVYTLSRRPGQKYRIVQLTIANGQVTTEEAQ